MGTADVLVEATPTTGAGAIGTMTLPPEGRLLQQQQQQQQQQQTINGMRRMRRLRTTAALSASERPFHQRMIPEK